MKTDGSPFNGRDAAASGDTVSLCTILSSKAIFGIDLREIHEVLERQSIRHLPLAPSYVAGLVPYKGEVLVTVSLRALLGRDPDPKQVCILVFEDSEDGERFGVSVDAVDGVRAARTSMLEANPCTLDSKTDKVLAGVYKTNQGLIVHLDPSKLRPSKL